MTKNIVVFDQPVGNRGDQAAHKAFMELLKSKGYNVTVVFGHEEDFVKPFHENISGVNYVCLPKARNADRFERLLRKTLAILSPLCSMLIPSSRKIAKLFRDADIVVCAPGGVSMGAYKSWRHILDLESALRKNRNVAIWGRSIGPFYDKTAADRRFARISVSILNRIGHISLRDLKSQEFIKQLGFPFCPSIDTAFTSVSQCEFPSELQYLKQEDYVVFVPNKLYEWHPYFKEVASELMDRFYVGIMNHLIQNKMKVLMLPQLFNLGCNGDVHYFEHLKKMVDDKQGVVVVSERYDSDVQQAIIRQAKALIGARYHSMIFAINNEVPFLCLSYEHKMHDTLRLLGLEKYSIDLYELIASNNLYPVLNQFDSLLENADDLKNLLGDKHKQARQIVMNAFEQFCNYANQVSK